MLWGKCFLEELNSAALRSDRHEALRCRTAAQSRRKKHTFPEISANYFMLSSSFA